MAGGSDQRHEVICIEAKRVCDFCFQEHRVERRFDVTVPANARTHVDCEIDTAKINCREVERREVDGKKSKFLVCVAVDVPVRIHVGDQTLERTITFLKQAILCAPAGTEVDCQVTGNCCCVLAPHENKVLCVFDFCIIIQTQVTVRILVPTLGMCLPKQCRSVVGGCPPRMANELCDRCDDELKWDRDHDHRDHHGHHDHRDHHDHHDRDCDC